MVLLDDVASDISGGHVFYDKESGFAQDATYISGGTGTFVVIFEDDYTELLDGELVMMGRQLRAWVRQSEQPTVGDVIAIDGTHFDVMAREPHDDGEVLLRLRLAS